MTASRIRISSTVRRLGVAGLLALAASTTLAAQVSLSGLPDLAGGALFSEGRAVSDDGTVVVGRSSSAASTSNNDEGVRWSGGNTLALGDLPGGEYSSVARGVSADGTLTVGSSRAKHTGWSFAQWRACTWTATGQQTELPNLAGVDQETTHAYAASADGAVIVGMSGGTATVNSAVAVRWTSNGAEALGWLPTNNESRAYDVSDDGTVIVGTATGGGPDHAFRWVEGVGLTDLGANTTAEAVSADGTWVVGTLAGGEAGRWSAAGGWQSLGSDFTPRGISADGNVVVGTQTGPGFGFAVIWTPAGGERNLIEVVEGEWGHGLGGWTLGLGWDVSPDGTQIVGRGKNPSNQSEGFHLELPREPWTAFGGGLAGGAGAPILHGTGSLLVGTPIKLKIAAAPHNAPVFLVVGSTTVFLPLAGGTLVPSLDLVLGGLATGNQGTLNINGTWPTDIPAGLELYVQAWMVDATGPEGYSATNGLGMVVP